MKIDLANITKGRLTGEELGKLALKNCLDGLIAKDKKTPITFEEFKKIAHTIESDYNVKTYNKYVELGRFLLNESISLSEYRYKMEILLWKVTCLLTEVPRHRPLEAEDLKGLRRMICELMDHIKNFFYIQSVIELGAKFTGVDEFLYLLYDFPGDLVRVLNHYIYYSNKDLPLIEIYKIPPETFKKALAEVKDIQDLYNEDKLKELLTNGGNE